MNRFLLTGIAVVVSGLGIVAVATSSDLSIVVGGAALAVASAGAVVALFAWPEVRRSVRRPPSTAADPLASLRDALSAGSLGRERVVFAVQSLEFQSGLRSGATWSPQQVRDLLALPSGRFREWLETRLDALERET